MGPWGGLGGTDRSVPPAYGPIGPTHSRAALEELEEFFELLELFARRVDDRALFLQRRRPPVFVLQPHSLGPPLDGDGLHRWNVEPHGIVDCRMLITDSASPQTPAAAEARSASATPITIVAVGAPSEPPP